VVSADRSAGAVRSPAIRAVTVAALSGCQLDAQLERRSYQVAVAVLVLSAQSVRAAAVPDRAAFERASRQPGRDRHGTIIAPLHTEHDKPGQSFAGLIFPAAVVLLLMTQPAQRPEFRFQVPDDLTAGVYSNLVGVWHSPFEFTLDFAVTLPPELVTDDDGTQRIEVPARVVARVKLPPAQVFELMQVLSQNERSYEQNFGQISRPGASGQEPPLFPPEA
jgi:Protein of unknown function (DUF3467)